MTSDNGPTLAGIGAGEAALLDSFPAHIALLDSSGVIVAANRAWRNFARDNGLRDPACAVGANYLSVCARAKGPWANEAGAAEKGIRTVLSGDAPLFKLEYPCHSPERWRWFRMLVTPLAGKAVSGAVVMHIDVTDRKQTELQLRENQERLDNAQQLAQLGSWEFDFDQDLLTWSPETYRIFGITPNQFAGTIEAFLAFIHPDDLDRFQKAQEQALARQAPLDVEHRIVRADGTVAHIHERGRLLTNSRGRTVLSGTVQDITARIQREEEARRAADIQLKIVRIQREIAAGDLTPQGALELLAVRSRELVGAEGSAIELGDGDDMVYRAVSGTARDQLGLRLARQGSLSGMVMETGEAAYCKDSETDPRVDRQACRRVGSRSMFLVPLKVGEEVTGVLKVFSSQPDAFSPADCNNLQILTESLGVVIQRHRAMEELAWSEQQYRLMFEHNPQPMLIYDRETLRILAVNDAATVHYGYTESEFRELTVADIRPPEDVPRLMEILQDLGEGINRTPRARHLKKDGSAIDVEIVSQSIDFYNQPARLVMINDITQRLRTEEELARISRAQRLLSRCNEVLVRTHDESVLIKEICRVAVEVGGYRMAWVGFAENNEAQTIRPAAWAGEEKGYLETVTLSWSPQNPEGRGPAGRTVREGRPVTVEDISRDPDFQPWLDEALARGYRGAVLLPLRREQRTFGVLCLYLPEARTISDDEIDLLQELADDLAFGVDHLRSESERQRLQNAVLKVAAGVSATSGTRFFEQLTANMADALGAHGAFVARTVDEAPAHSRIFAGTVGGEPFPEVTYPLETSPCAALLDSNVAIVVENVRARFPNSPPATAGGEIYVGRRLNDSTGRHIGQLFVTFESAPADTGLVLSLVEIFAARAAAELERQEADSRIRDQASLLDRARDAIIVRDLSHRIQYWNEGAERLYGWSAAEARGRSVADLLYDHDEEFTAATRRVLEKGDWQGRIRQRTRGGESLVVEAHWSLLRDEAGQPRRIFAINTDITERLAMEEQLEQSQRLESLGQLTGGIAHDFNNLLTVITGNAEMLAARLKDQPRLQSMAKMSETAAQRAAQLTQRLLAFARRQSLEPRPVDVNALLADMDSLLRRTLKADIEVRYHPGEDLWLARVDPTQLEGAVLNLAINARDAMPTGGALTVETANIHLGTDRRQRYEGLEAGDYVLVRVSDTGTGISAEDRERVFDPFFTTKEKGKGTGLGLSMVYGFIKQSRGHVMLESEPGLGTTIEMYLPRAPEPGTGEEAGTAATPQPAGGSEKILLVEDDHLVRRYVADQLAGLGYRVITAANARAALDIVERADDIDLLFTDIVMPGTMNGLELAQAARQRRPSLNVLLTSGYTENTSLQEGDIPPGMQLLAKPYRGQELARKVRSTLDRQSRAPNRHWRRD